MSFRKKKSAGPADIDGDGVVTQAEAMDTASLGIGLASLGVGIASLIMALNRKPIKGEQLEKVKRTRLIEQRFPGIYVMDDGRVVEMHEWEDPDWYDIDDEDEWSDYYADMYPDSKPPKGSVYYDIFDHRGEADGGVMGYDEHDDLSAFEQFESGRISALVLRPGDPGYHDLLDALRDGRYSEVRDAYGLPNRKSGKRRFGRSSRRGRRSRR